MRTDHKTDLIWSLGKAQFETHIISKWLIDPSATRRLYNQRVDIYKAAKDGDITNYTRLCKMFDEELLYYVSEKIIGKTLIEFTNYDLFKNMFVQRITTGQFMYDITHLLLKKGNLEWVEKFIESGLIDERIIDWSYILGSKRPDSVDVVKKYWPNCICG